MKIKALFILMILTFPATTMFSQSTQNDPASSDDITPKYSNEFLAIGVGAGPLGMSNSVVASTNDVYSGYWNPAGLANLENDIEVGAMHAEYFAGIANFDYAAVAKKVDDQQSLGLSVIRFGVDNILNTTELIDNQGNIDYDRIELFSAADYAFILSYARKSKIEGLDIGANAKIIYRQIGDFAKSWGFGIDVGAQYQKNDWRFGITARDITTTFNAWKYSLSDGVKETFENTGNEIPTNDIELTLPSFTLGAARSFQWDKVSLLAEANINMTTDGKRQAIVSSNSVSLYPRLGLQLDYENTVFIRGGFGNLQYETNFDESKDFTFQPNIGVGLRIRKIFIDYALSDIGDQSAALYSNVISLKLNFESK